MKIQTPPLLPYITLRAAAEGLVSPILVLLLNDVCRSSSKVAFLLSIMSLTSLVTRIPVGIVVDIYGSKIPLILSAVTSGIGKFLLTLSCSQVLVCISMVFLGLSLTLHYVPLPAFYAKISHTVHELTRMYSSFITCEVLVISVFSMVGGYLSEYTTRVQVFVVSSIVSMIPIPYLVVTSSLKCERCEVRYVLSSKVVNLIQELRNYVTILYMVYSILDGLFWSTLILYPLLLSKDLLFTDMMIGVTIFVAELMYAVGTYLGGKVQVSYRVVILLPWYFVSLLSLITYTLHPSTLTTISLPLLYFLAGLPIPIVTGLILKNVRAKGIVSGISGFGWRLGYVIGTLLLTQIHERVLSQELLFTAISGIAMILISHSLLNLLRRHSTIKSQEK